MIIRNRPLSIALGSIIAITLFVSLSAASARPKKKPAPRKPPAAFTEIWGFLMKGEEKEITGAELLSDICYFGVAPERDGSLRGVRDFPKLPANRHGIQQRVHLVVFDINNAALMRTVLAQGSNERAKLIAEIAAATSPFAGVNIDFEAVPPDMRAQFLDFLAQMRLALPVGKILSVAVPARRIPITDAYDYAAIAEIVDRVFIMAYDQHWRNSKPGPVASLGWCDAIASYAKQHIPSGKLVMGLPLYGRVWQDRRIGHSVRHSDVESILKRKRRLKPRVHRDRGPSLVYNETIRVIIYYEDMSSISSKLALYRRHDIGQVGFWRIGQGPRTLWSLMELKK